MCSGRDVMTLRPADLPTPTTGEPSPAADSAGPAATAGALLRRTAIAGVCALLGFLLVAQARATEDLDQRLAGEREEDLARILADLSAQSDRLQLEITELRLTLFAFENEAQDDELAVTTLQRRLDDLRILSGTAPAQGTGLALTVVDRSRLVTQELLVDTVQELRDAGAEAIAIGDVRLVASSAFATRNGRIVLDGSPLDPPYRILAIGPTETLAKALAIPGGAIDTLESQPGVVASVEPLSLVTVPARGEPVPFVFGEPVTPAPQ